MLGLSLTRRQQANQVQVESWAMKSHVVLDREKQRSKRGEQEGLEFHKISREPCFGGWQSSRIAGGLGAEEGYIEVILPCGSKS